MLMHNSTRYQFNKSKSKINKIVLSVQFLRFVCFWLSFVFRYSAKCVCVLRINTRERHKTRWRCRMVKWKVISYSRTRILWCGEEKEKKTHREIAAHTLFSVNESNIRQSITVKNSQCTIHCTKHWFISHSNAYILEALQAHWESLRINICSCGTRITAEKKDKLLPYSYAFFLIRIYRWVWVWAAKSVQRSMQPIQQA